ncbi:MAG: carbohydrate ABC transporter permease [Chloroflexota bacterium]|nr:carbohydrate ABC transporter permease [Chloroflexota bacterium]
MSGGRFARVGVRFGDHAQRVPYWQVVAGYAALLLLALVALFPVVTIWLTGFKTNTELLSGFFGLPQQWHWENFAAAWDRGRFGTFFANSVIVVVPVVVVSLVLSTLAGFGFARWRFRGSGILFFLLLVGLMVPFEAVIVPLYYDMRAIGLLNTYWALILPQIGMSVAFGTFWMRAFFLSAPAELLDAAAVDGANPLRALWAVMLPLAQPALLTLAVLLFTWTWNEFLLALVLVSDEAVRTLPVGLAFFVGQYSADVPLLAAGATIVSTPIVVAFLIFQRSFIRGMVAGAIRG